MRHCGGSEAGCFCGACCEIVKGYKKGCVSMNCTPKVRQKTFGVQFVYEKDIHREAQNSKPSTLWGTPETIVRTVPSLAALLRKSDNRYRKYGEGGLYSKAQKKISSDFKVKLVRDFT